MSEKFEQPDFEKAQKTAQEVIKEVSSGYDKAKRRGEKLISSAEKKVLKGAEIRTNKVIAEAERKAIKKVANSQRNEITTDKNIKPDKGLLERVKSGKEVLTPEEVAKVEIFFSRKAGKEIESRLKNISKDLKKADTKEKLGKIKEDIMMILKNNPEYNNALVVGLQALVQKSAVDYGALSDRTNTILDVYNSLTEVEPESQLNEETDSY